MRQHKNIPQIFALFRRNCNLESHQINQASSGRRIRPPKDVRGMFWVPPSANHSGERAWAAARACERNSWLSSFANWWLAAGNSHGVESFAEYHKSQLSEEGDGMMLLNEKHCRRNGLHTPSGRVGCRVQRSTFIVHRCARSNRNRGASQHQS